jgi:tetratricopeptide (TPR) repeat protein
MSFDFKPDSQQQEPDIMPPKDGGGAFTVAALILFMLLAAGGFFWEPVATAMKAALARQSVEAAREAIVSKDWSRAAQLLAAARRRAPDDIEVIRVTIEFLKATKHDPGGLVQQLNALDRIKPLDVEELVLLGNTLITAGKVAEARAVFEKLPPGQNTQQAMELLSNILKAEGHGREAEAMSRRAKGWKSDDPEVHLKAALEDRRSTFQEIRTSASARLWELARLKTDVGLRAIQELAVDASLSLQEAGELLVMVDQHPLKNIQTRLVVVSALMRLQPDQRSRLVNQEIHLFKTKGQGTLEDIAFWLMREHRHDELLALVPLKLAVKSRELYPIFLQTLVQQRRWKELQEMLSTPQQPVGQGLVNTAMAEVKAHLQPDMIEARQLLERTVQSAQIEGNLAVLQAAARTAEKLNLADIATSAYTAAAERSAAAGANEEAVRQLQNAGDSALIAKNTAALLSVFRKLHELRPSSTAFADNFTYLRLILGVEMETVDFSNDGDSPGMRAAAHMPVKRVPSELLRALAAYRLGDDVGVAHHLAGLRDITGLSAGQRAVAAGLLSLTGRQDRAYQIAEKVPGALLLEEERVFLRKAL